MRIDRRTFLLVAMLAAGCSRSTQSGPLRRAAEYLWRQQDPDGGFHSSTYGLLRSGQSLTPFVLNALLDVPESIVPRPAGAIDRALGFIKKNTNVDGALGLMDETSVDYPNYATALAITVMTKVSAPRGDIARMVDQLRAQQFSEANGWKRDDPAFGGWGMGGSLRRPPNAGHVDISMTRFVLEALNASGVPASDRAMKSALIYLERSQNADGGFYFSPVNPEINKAGEENGRYVSYATATADGALALRAAGITETDDRIVKAIAWLRSHHQPDRAPGFETSPDPFWGQGLRFYYAHVISRILPDSPIELPPQYDDGSFHNPNKLVKEDDPLIATAFALSVLRR
jgi:prenyltransferase beta subunit